MKATYKKYTLDFKVPSGPSRGILSQKETYFLVLLGDHGFGIGECGLLYWLSLDDVRDYEQNLAWVCYSLHVSNER